MKYIKTIAHWGCYSKWAEILPPNKYLRLFPLSLIWFMVFWLFAVPLIIVTQEICRIKKGDYPLTYSTKLNLHLPTYIHYTLYAFKCVRERVACLSLLHLQALRLIYRGITGLFLDLFSFLQANLLSLKLGVKHPLGNKPKSLVDSPLNILVWPLSSEVLQFLFTEFTLQHKWRPDITHSQSEVII